ncbi:MAG: acyl-CoA dehydrogenase family protein [Chloroflexi bacterium]|nr:acyl-CoA dehydrogenase family protein [Chloroflexota bacterium]
MNFEFTEEQAMIRATMRDFAEKEIAPLASENDRNEHFPADIVAKMGAMGFLGINLPARYGGGDGDYMSYCIMLEELAKADVGLAAVVSAHLSLAGKSILNWGNEAQKQEFLPRLARGEILGCLASTEPNVGSDVASIETSATLHGEEWVLNGNKIWITNGGVAGVVVVIAQTDRSQGSKGITAFLLEPGTPGFSTRDIHGKLGVRSSNTAELILQDCRLPRENMLGPLGKGMSVALSAFDSARLGVAARSVGGAQACLEAAIAYAQTRRQFGKLIGGFQLIQELIADMTVEIEAARFLIYRAATKKDGGEPATLEVSMAKYYASEIALRAANNALQIHGSYGYSDEFPMARILRDVRVSSILEGTSQIHKLIIGRAMTGINAFV